MDTKEIEAGVNENESSTNQGRRKFLGTTAVLGLAGAGLTATAGLSSSSAAEGSASASGAGTLSDVVKPGQLDDYYGLWSGGHSGEVRVYGVPSGRTLKRIPVFNRDFLTGWGQTNESKKILGTKPDGSMKYDSGDTHHVHGSYKDGTYDGKYAWVNDKLNSRLARIRLDTMECDKITELPNVQGFHGIFPDKRDPVKSEVNTTTRVFCGCEFHIPQPNDGRDEEDPKKYYTIFTCVDSETMEVRWQCKIDGNMDLVATSYDGKLAASNQYNTENGVHYEDMMAVERDACVFFNVARIEEAVKNGKSFKIGASNVPVVDGTKAANADPKTALTAYVSVPKNPHGVNASPDGKYFICSGKLSPTATVIDLAKVLEWFDGKLAKLDDAIVAEPELGLGPLHTAFDGRGNAFTTLFLDSQVVKWNIDKAIKFYASQGKGEKNYVVDRLDVSYQPGHLNASMSETREADGKWLGVGNKFSKDRFLPVGPLHAETEQLVDISGEKMRLAADHAAYSEPHDFIIVRRDIIHTRQVYDLDEFPNAIKAMKDSRVERNGKKVTIHIAGQAPAFALREFKVKHGDEVTIIYTNLDKVEDLTHGFGIANYGINFICNPLETKSVTFTADKKGVFWCYCTHFCHALHLEMRSRMMVEA
ncbi:MAG: nitrous-oxide reductase [Rhodanobacter sp.]|jgi:nitrous-oxide reductase|nr:nitrous-oxide reductase [Rhodanobacter sp.]